MAIVTVEVIAPNGANNPIPISGAFVYIYNDGQGVLPISQGTTNANGLWTTPDIPDGNYTFETTVFGEQSVQPINIDINNNRVVLAPALTASIVFTQEDFVTPVTFGRNQGDVLGVLLELGRGAAEAEPTTDFRVSSGNLINARRETDREIHWQPLGAAGRQTVTATVTDTATNATFEITEAIDILRLSGFQAGDTVPVSLSRSGTQQTRDQILWVAIRNRTEAISFTGSGYSDFIISVLGQGNTTRLNGRNRQVITRQQNSLSQPIHGVSAYELLRTATEVFLLMEAGTNIQGADRYTNEQLFDPNEEAQRLGRTLTLREAVNQLAGYLGNGRLPYIERVIRNAFPGEPETNSIFTRGILADRASNPPLIELIWSYWHEEAMLVQTMNAISLRFQNRRGKGERDPLAHLEIAPLYPLNNLLWGYIQDEVHSLSVTRRNYEYNHHYGLSLQGAAISDFRPADSRSRFLEGFHNLLHQATVFYKQDDDTTFQADSFPLLNSLREVHLILAEGAHNQFGDLPWTARVEMLMQQWLLSRPELRQFLQSRQMVPYREGWMAQVDTMKQLQGWTDVSVTHFNYLATFGERILLSIRYGNWVDVTNSASAANWARYWRPEIQNYIHSYRAATGVDLATEAKDSRQEKLRVMQPSKLIEQRLKSGRHVPAVSDTGTEPVSSGFRQRRASRAAANGRK
ncbi:MAG: carboxypeptidase regulatory-like domain-containing protein [Anaerolineaceae bacterium]|nr:carboxypeptidase regulatory-like domain-containing protein [Anaerolineaceae bacterium]